MQHQHLYKQEQQRQRGAYGFQKPQRFGGVGPLADATTSSTGVGTNLHPRSKLVEFGVDQYRLDFANLSIHRWRAAAGPIDPLYLKPHLNRDMILVTLDSIHRDR